MKKKGTSSAILAGLSAWCLLLASLLGGVYFLISARWFYAFEYEKHGQAQVIGVSDETLMGITDGLLGYLGGKRDDLDMQAEVNGEWREVFTQREKDHMVDVRKLTDLAVRAFYAFLTLGLGLLALAIVLAARHRAGKRMCIGYLIGAGSFLAFVGVIALFFVIDFTSAFYMFHLLFFTNDLWLLPPDSIMIQMVPEVFFADCAVALVIFFAAGLLGICIPAFVLSLVLKSPKKGNGQAIRTRVLPGGDELYEIRETPLERPDAEQIFEKLGLEEIDEAEEGLYETRPEEEMPTVRPGRVPMPEPVPEATVMKPAGDRAREAGVRLEMKLELKVVKTENGVELVADPSKPMDIRLSANEGELAFLVDALGSEEGHLLLDGVGTAHPPQRTQRTEERQAEEEIFYPPVEERPRVSMEPPSVDDLLKKMNDLMKDYPDEDKDGLQA